MVKKTLKEAIGYFLVGTYPIRRTEFKDILSIFFHNPAKKEFEDIVAWLAINGFSFISIDELYQFIQSGQKPKGRLAFLSFDDGWRGNLELVEVIEKYKAPISIFITTGAIEEGNYWWEYAAQKDQYLFSGIKNIEAFKALPVEVWTEKVGILRNHYQIARSSMSRAELIALNQHPLVTIGAHTMTHPILKNCSAERQHLEIAGSRQLLSDWLDQEIDFLAYPNGDYNSDTLRIIKELGFKLALSTQPGRIDPLFVDPFLIPRNSIEEGQGYFESLSKVLGVWQKWKAVR